MQIQPKAMHPVHVFLVQISHWTIPKERFTVFASYFWALGLVITQFELQFAFTNQCEKLNSLLQLLIFWVNCVNFILKFNLGFSSFFSYPAFKARKILAAIDWNSHCGRPRQTNKETGEDLVTRKYNPRTVTWCTKDIVEQKDFDYILMMIAHVFRRRTETNVAFASKVEMEADDPRQIAPTIAKIAPVPTSELKGKRQSRIKNKIVK